jgi:cytidylate kinase
MFRLVTVSREHGSGGGQIARLLAEKLQWKLLDNALIQEIARIVQLDPSLVERYDERVDPWIHRISRQGLWLGAFEGVSGVPRSEVFDAERMFQLSCQLILEAAEVGNCVVVGRGGQCLLQTRPDCFHVFIYAPFALRVERIKARYPSARNVEELISARDAQRTSYTRQHFKQDRYNVHLYQMAINSEVGEQAVVSAISCAMKGSTT